MNGEALNYLNMLHEERADGYIAIMQFDENRKAMITNGTYDNLTEIINEFEGKKDVYISPNTFYIPKRNAANIRQFRSLYIDLDVEKHTNYSIDEAFYTIFDLVNEDEIPHPSIIINSGRGLHVYWLIQDAPKQSAYLWQELENAFYHKLKHLGADPAVRDSARILRLPGTINSKNDKICSVAYENIGNKYSLYDLRDKYLPKKPKRSNKPQKIKKTQKTVVKKFPFNSYSLHRTRIEDIKTLCCLRNWDMKGYRNTLVMAFAYCTAVCTKNTEALDDVVLDFNNNFKVPLTLTEVRSTLRTAKNKANDFADYEQAVRKGLRAKAIKGKNDKPGYWFSNQYLIENLKISPEEQKHLKTIIGKEETSRRDKERKKAARRNSDGLTKREQMKQDKIGEVNALAEQGLKQTEIAKIVGINKSTVSKILRGIY